MEVQIAEQGSKEFCETRAVFQHFKTLKPYLAQSPKALICPGDKARVAATNIQSLGNSNISYFVGIDVRAGDTNSSANIFLSGDRNLTNGTETPSHTFYTISTNQPLGWNNRIHATGGNIAFADLHVSHLTTIGLQTQIAKLRWQTNRIAIP